MNARRTVLPLALLGLAVALRASAVDAPHDASTSAADCTACHSLHAATGAGLTNQPTNFTLCSSCHNNLTAFGFPWSTADQAAPGSTGAHHHWDSLANNATYGAVAPTSRQMSIRIKNGYLQCSTCHDQHANNFRGTQHVSVTPGASLSRIAGTGTGSLVLNQPSATASPKGYLIEIVLGGNAGTATFHISNDGGTSWFGWSGTAWVAGAAAGAPTGTAVVLNDGTNMTVTFTGSFVAGDRWQKFYISYPFLRIANDASQMCEDCHSPRVQTPAYVESGGDGVKVFSHPVGVALARSYDRAPAALLDANGALQTTGDGIPTNDLRLDAANNVRCMTCHYPHNADGNSLTMGIR